MSSGTEAGQAFERAASIQTSKLSEPDDAANSLTEAYKSYRKSSPQDAARVLSQAINHYTTKGNFRRAATNQQNLAELYEVEVGDEKAALEAYEVAAGWFEGDNAEALANKLFLKVGDLAATAGEYQKAVEQYEKVAKSSVSNNLMKWSVKDYFLKAGICHLASGVRYLALLPPDPVKPQMLTIPNRTLSLRHVPLNPTETLTLPFPQHANTSF